MKNYMKKITIIFGLALLLLGQSTFALNPWNGDPADCDQIRIRTTSTSGGAGCSSWSTNPVTVAPGGMVYVALYYHNTSTGPMTNTKLSVTKSPNSGASSSFTFSNVISSDQASQSSGTVTANITSSQTLTFASATWYPDQSSSPSSFPNGQSGSEVMNGGVNIGTIGTGWSHQGSIVVAFSVGNYTPTCVISNLSANSNPIIPPANSSQLTWANNGCTSVTISPAFSNGSNSVTANASGSVTVMPTSTTTYTITGVNGSATSSKSITVTIGSAAPTPCVVTSFSANPSTITAGGTAQLSWTTNGNCTSLNISPTVGAVYGSSGSVSVTPSIYTYYSITGYGATGSPSVLNTSVTVTVPSTCIIYSFYANSSVINLGDSTLLNWTTNGNCTSLSISPGVSGSLNANGSASVTPTSNTNYVITGQGSTGGTVTKNVTVTVNNTTPPTSCTITSFTANGSTISVGGTSQLSWTTNGNCTSLTISPNVGSVYGASGSVSVSPTINTTYIISGQGSSGSYSSLTANVTVNAVANCIVYNIYSNYSSITTGGTAMLFWTTNGNCTLLDISNYGPVSGTTGNVNVSPTVTTTYAMTGYGSNGSTSSKNTTITVNGANNSTACAITSFIANPSTITAGNSSALSWTTNGNCTSLTISPNPGVVYGTSGATTVSPSITSTYSISGTGASGSATPLTTTVTVTAGTSSCAITSFIANPNGNVSSGNPVVLSWTTTGTCGQIYINGNPVSGNYYTVYPTANTTYSLTSASGPASSVYVSVNAANNTVPTATTNYPTNIGTSRATIAGYVNGQGAVINGWLEFPCFGAQYGNVSGVTTANLSTVIYSLSPNNTYSYCAVAQNPATNVIYRANQISFTTTSSGRGNNNYSSPSVSTYSATNVSTNSATINGYADGNGDYNTTSWFRYGTSSGYLGMTTNIANRSSGGQNISEYLNNLSPNTTYYYQAAAQNSYDTVYGSIQQFTTGSSFLNNNGQTTAVTTVATNVTTGSATLNGLLLNTINSNTNVYFEYGTNVTLGGVTNRKYLGLGTSVPFSENITGLSPDTLYYFRANAENSAGVSHGSIEIFRTPGNYTNTNTNTTTTRTVYVNTGVTRAGLESPILLKIENRNPIFTVGDMVDYTITYSNIGSTKLTRPLLQVILPKYVTFVNTSRGTYDIDTSTISVALEDLEPQAGGVLYVQGKVVSLPDNHSDIVTTAILVYTNSAKAQENAMAYVLNHDYGYNNNNVNLGASAGFLNFWGLGLLGWLLLLILILLIILIARTYRRRYYDEAYYAPYVAPRPVSNHTDNQGIHQSTPHT